MNKSNDVDDWTIDKTMLQRIIDALPVGVWIADAKGHLKLNNPAGTNVWQGARWVAPEGYGEYKGWWSDTGEPLAAKDWGMARAVATGEESRDEMIDIECFDGTRKTILNSALLIRDENGVPCCAVATNQDITALKRTQDELLETKRQLAALSKELLAVQERERHNLSRELHDGIGQTLTALKFTLETARKRCCKQSINDVLGQAIDISNVLVANIREIARSLRPPQLDYLGLLPAIRAHIDSVTQLTGVSGVLKSSLPDMRFDHNLELACFRIIQEAINNIIKHAEASQFQVELSIADNKLFLSVRDDGKGFTNQQHPHKAPLSLGLVGMRERAIGLNGQLGINSAPGEGTEILAIFPISETTR